MVNTAHMGLSALLYNGKASRSHDTIHMQSVPEFGNQLPSKMHAVNGCANHNKRKPFLTQSALDIRLIVIAVVVVVLIAGPSWLFMRKRKSTDLRQKFGTRIQSCRAGAWLRSKSRSQTRGSREAS